MLWMLSPDLAMVDEICPSMFGTLALAMATRCGASRGMSTLGKFTAFWMVPCSRNSRTWSTTITAQFLLGLRGRRAEVRQRDHVRLGEQRSARKIAQVVLQPLRTQGGDNGRVVDNGIAREVEQHRARLDARKALGVDHVAGGVDQGHMQGHEVGVLQHFLDRVGLAHARREPPRSVDGDLRVEADDLHAELDGGVRNEAAHRAQPDDAERALRQLHPGKLLLALLDARFEKSSAAASSEAT